MLDIIGMLAFIIGVIVIIAIVGYVIMTVGSYLFDGGIQLAVGIVIFVILIFALKGCMG